MPWIDILDEHRNKIGTAHLCMRSRHLNYCAFCAREGLRQLSSKLCDGKVARGTCDAPICDFHATHIDGKDLDFCPNHKSQAPRTLFDEVADGTL